MIELIHDRCRAPFFPCTSERQGSEKLSNLIWSEGQGSLGLLDRLLKSANLRFEQGVLYLLPGRCFLRTTP